MTFELKYYQPDSDYHKKLSWTPGYRQSSISIQQTAQKLQFASFYNFFYEINMPHLCKIWN